VVGYRFGLDGDSGELAGAVTLACTVGDGSGLSVTPGAGGYVASGYVQNGYQALTSGEAQLPTADVKYTYYGGASIDDDGIDFFNFGASQAVVACTVTNGPAEQAALIAGTQHADAAAAISALNEIPTSIQLQMRPVDGLTFRTDYSLTVGDVVIPKTIDLESA